jgi:hypothetical protein
MYNQHSSDTGVVDRLSDVKDDDIIAFIRFRILAQTLDARKRIDELVRERIDQCDAVRGYEVPNSPFGIEENFITRFGNTRLQQVFDLIEAASRLGLSFAGSEEPINPNGDGGPQGLVHLVANPLRYLHAGYASVVQIWGKGGFTQSTLL